MTSSVDSFEDVLGSDFEVSSCLSAQCFGASLVLPS